MKIQRSKVLVVPADLALEFPKYVFEVAIESLAGFSISADRTIWLVLSSSIGVLTAPTIGIEFADGLIFPTRSTFLHLWSPVFKRGVTNGLTLHHLLLNEKQETQIHMRFSIPRIDLWT